MTINLKYALFVFMKFDYLFIYFLGELLAPLGDAISTNEVINQLLHHVGAMCIHQLNVLAASNNLPISNFLGKQHPIEGHHLTCICDIMEKAMVNGDTCIIHCILVVFQVGIFFYLFGLFIHLFFNIPPFCLKRIMQLMTIKNNNTE